MHYDEIIAQNQSWIDDTWAKIEKKATAAAIKGRNKIPYTTDAQGNHTDKSKDPHMWTNGFWGAYMWLMYEATKNEEFALTARNCEAVMDKCFDDMDMLHHDVGFMWHIMTGARYAQRIFKIPERQRWQYHDDRVRFPSSRYDGGKGIRTNS